MKMNMRFGFLVVLFILVSKTTAECMNETSTCVTKSCIHTADNILRNMDQNVDPCDNFYKFACGGFEKHTIIPEDKSSVTTYGLTRDLVQSQMYSILQEPLKDHELKPFANLKKIYQACMDTTKIEERGDEPLKNMLKKLGGWPVLMGNKWHESKFDWKETIYKLRKIGYGVGYIIDTSVVIDSKNTTRRVLELDQSSLFLSKEYFNKGLDHKVVKAYYSYMVDIAVMLGANREIAEEELMLSLQFEKKLAEISLPNEKRRNSSLLYNPITINELQTKYPYIGWHQYINKILEPEASLSADEVVIVCVPTFLKNLDDILAETSNRTIANYLLWRVASTSVSYLNKKYRDRQLVYGTAINGKTDRGARWKECVDKASGKLALASGSIYVRNYFDEDAKKETLDMVENLRSTFKEILQNLDWMDGKTKMAALEKVAAMTNHIAYPDELLDDKKMEEFYEQLEVDETKYLESALNVTKFGNSFAVQRLRQRVNITSWLTHGRASVVNAFYSPNENSIQFPAGIFQGMFFAKDRPRYLNYGCIGFTIGHEITHGFDDHGRQFDNDGNLVDWWLPETKEAFVKKAQCIVDQYGSFYVPEISANLNGIVTQGENIADNGGMKEAYLAYDKWAKNHEIEPKLPGLPYTPHQLFWISAANKWCSTYRPQFLEYLVLTDPHAPGMFRINGPMSNLAEFAKDFNCPVGSKMNPEHKCKVW